MQTHFESKITYYAETDIYNTQTDTDKIRLIPHYHPIDHAQSSRSADLLMVLKTMANIFLGLLLERLQVQ